MRFAITTLARAVEDVDLSSATTATRTGPAVWTADGGLEVPFDRDLTPTEVDAVVLLLTSATTAEAGIRKAALAYLAIPAPTAAQTASQVKGITRVLLRLLDQHH